MVQRGRAQARSAPRPAPARDPGPPRRRAPRARRPRESGRPSLRSGVYSFARGHAENTHAGRTDAAGGGARDRRDRRRTGRAVRETERHIRDRRAARALRGHAIHDGETRGLVPSRAALPGGAHRRVRRALLLRAGRRAASRARGGCRATPGATPTRRCASGSRRSGGSSAATYRVLVDANQHVDREGAARAGVGFYGKNTLLITRRYGSWVVLGTLVTEAEIESSAPLDARLRRRAGSASTPARRARSTSPASSTRRAASPTGRRRRARSPRSSARSSATRSTAATSARTSARGTAGSRSAARTRSRPPARSPSSRSPTGSRRPTTSCASATTGSTSRRTTRATCAATRSSRRGNSGDPALAAARCALRRRRTTSCCASTRPGPPSRLAGAGMNERQRAQEMLDRAMRGSSRSSSPRSRSWSSRDEPGREPHVGMGHHGDPRGRRRRLPAPRAAAAQLADAHRFSGRSRSSSTRRSSTPSSSRTPSRRERQASRLLVLAVIEAAVRYGVAGGVGLTVAQHPAARAVEYDARRAPANAFEFRNVTLTARDPADRRARRGRAHAAAAPRVGALAEARAAEAEQLRDEIGRHADRLELANRCARALASSLDMKESFQPFVRELRRRRSTSTGSRSSSPTTAAPIVVADDGTGVVDGASPWSRPLDDSALGGGGPHGPDARTRRPEGRRAARRRGTSSPRSACARASSRRCRSRASRSACSRCRAATPDSFTRGRRRPAHAARPPARDGGREHPGVRGRARRVEELRRLSALRADFVSLVTHELRGPMASVVGCAATLRQRWRTLNAAAARVVPRADRGGDLAARGARRRRSRHVPPGGRHLHATRSSDVDVEELVREVAAVVDLGQEEVAIRTRGSRPAAGGARRPRADPPGRHEPAHERGQVHGRRATRSRCARRVETARVDVSVTDHGPGISRRTTSA